MTSLTVRAAAVAMLRPTVPPDLREGIVAAKALPPEFPAEVPVVPGGALPLAVQSAVAAVARRRAGVELEVEGAVPPAVGVAPDEGGMDRAGGGAAARGGDGGDGRGRGRGRGVVPLREQPGGRIAILRQRWSEATFAFVGGPAPFAVVPQTAPAAPFDDGVAVERTGATAPGKSRIDAVLSGLCASDQVRGCGGRQGQDGGEGFRVRLCESLRFRLRGRHGCTAP